MIERIINKLKNTYNYEMKKQEYHSCLDLIAIINNNVLNSKIDINTNQKIYIGINKFHQSYNELMNISYNAECEELYSFIDMINKNNMNIHFPAVELNEEVKQFKRINYFIYKINTNNINKIVYGFSNNFDSPK
jgi:hypothetical protein